VSRKAIPTELLAITDGDAERAELFWRLSVPILAFVLTLLAIPLSQVDPRLGRSFNLVSAAFLYLLYTNCLNIVQSLIAQGSSTSGSAWPRRTRPRWSSSSSCSATSCRCSGCSAGRRAPGPPEPRLRALT
jgi:hypothetical protein